MTQDTSYTTIQIDLAVRQDEESLKTIFIDRLQEALQISELGEVTRSVIHTDESEEPIAVSIILTTKTLHDKQIEGLQQLLCQFGAPKNSLMTVTQNDTTTSHTFGESQGLAMYLDGVNLDAKIYKKYDLSDAWNAIDNELKDAGMPFGVFEGKTESAIYSYGPDAETMIQNLEKLQQKHPLFRQSRHTILLDEIQEPLPLKS